MQALGVTDHRFLGGAGRWRDSGMMGTPGNDDPRAFWSCAKDEAKFAEAVAQAVAVIREVRPQVLVTYDENGGYGHPDHIMAHRVAMAAADARGAARAATATPWQVEKIYWTALPRSVLQAGIDALKAAGEKSFFDDVGLRRRPADGQSRRRGDDRRRRVRVRRGEGRRDARARDPDQRGRAVLRAVEQHRPRAAGRRVLPHSCAAELGPERDENGRETDLFAGVDE